MTHNTMADTANSHTKPANITQIIEHIITHSNTAHSLAEILQQTQHKNELLQILSDKFDDHIHKKRHKLKEAIDTVMPQKEAKLTQSIHSIMSIAFLILLQMDEQYVFHNLDHSITVVLNTIGLIKKTQEKGNTITAQECCELIVAALFHDTGNVIHRAWHELQSCAFVDEVFAKLGPDVWWKERIKQLILATTFPYQKNDTARDIQTQTMINIIRDADLAHLAADTQTHVRRFCKYFFEECALDHTKIERSEKQRMDLENNFMDRLHPGYQNATTQEERNTNKTENHIYFTPLRPRLYPMLYAFLHSKKDKVEEHYDVKAAYDDFVHKRPNIWKYELETRL